MVALTLQSPSRVKMLTHTWGPPLSGAALILQCVSVGSAGLGRLRRAHEEAVADHCHAVAAQVMPIQGTCLGHQLLQILASDVNFTELLVPTDAVVRRCSLQTLGLGLGETVCDMLCLTVGTTLRPHSVNACFMSCMSSLLRGTTTPAHQRWRSIRVWPSQPAYIRLTKPGACASAVAEQHAEVPAGGGQQLLHGVPGPRSEG